MTALLCLFAGAANITFVCRHYMKSPLSSQSNFFCSQNHVTLTQPSPETTVTEIPASCRCESELKQRH